MPLNIPNPPSKGDIALAIRCMRYADLRDMASDLATAASERAKNVEELGGFVIEDRVDWAELLVDWAEAN